MVMYMIAALIGSDWLWGVTALSSLAQLFEQYLLGILAVFFAGVLSFGAGCQTGHLYYHYCPACGDLIWIKTRGGLSQVMTDDEFGKAAVKAAAKKGK